MVYSTARVNMERWGIGVHGVKEKKGVQVVIIF